MLKRNLLLIIGILLFSAARAQEGDIEMADALFKSGRIFIVVISVLLILLGLLFYMIYLERKVKQLEKKLEDHEQNKFHA